MKDAEYLSSTLTFSHLSHQIHSPQTFRYSIQFIFAEDCKKANEWTKPATNGICMDVIKALPNSKMATQRRPPLALVCRILNQITCTNHVVIFETADQTQSACEARQSMAYLKVFSRFIQIQDPIFSTLHKLDKLFCQQAQRAVVPAVALLAPCMKTRNMSHLAHMWSQCMAISVSIDPHSGPSTQRRVPDIKIEDTLRLCGRCVLPWCLVCHVRHLQQHHGKLSREC